MKQWIKENKQKSMVIIEIGAGIAIPTVRWASENTLNDRCDTKTWLIRINPDD